MESREPEQEQMNMKKSIRHTAYLITLMISLISLGSCRNGSLSGWIIMTLVPASSPEPDYQQGYPWRYYPAARLVALKPGMPLNTGMILTESFFSACSPALSYDGSLLLFTGKKEISDPWQIWLLELEDLSIRQVTAGLENCIDPVYLPSGQIVFSRSTSENSLPPYYFLYSCKPDGSELKQISFHPHSDLATSIILDGRLLTVSRQLSPQEDEQKYLVLRPDGTNAELFYEPGKGKYLWGKGVETKNHEIVFIESSTQDPGKGELVAVNQNKPLNSRSVLSSKVEGSFHSASEMPSGKFLVSYRDSPWEH